jgi:hypothetical protein
VEHQKSLANISHHSCAFVAKVLFIHTVQFIPKTLSPRTTRYSVMPKLSRRDIQQIRMIWCVWPRELIVKQKRWRSESVKYGSGEFVKRGCCTFFANNIMQVIRLYMETMTADFVVKYRLGKEYG